MNEQTNEVVTTDAPAEGLPEFLQRVHPAAVEPEKAPEVEPTDGDSDDSDGDDTDTDAE